MKVVALRAVAQKLISPTPRNSERKTLIVDLHPADYSRILAAAGQFETSAEADFLALAMHVGATKLLYDKGLEIGLDNVVRRAR